MWSLFSYPFIFFLISLWCLTCPGILCFSSSVLRFLPSAVHFRAFLASLSPFTLNPSFPDVVAFENFLAIYTSYESSLSRYHLDGVGVRGFSRLVSFIFFFFFCYISSLLRLFRPWRLFSFPLYSRALCTASNKAKCTYFIGYRVE